MILKFKKIHLTNFMSFIDAEIQLDKPGYTLVSGINENPDDSAKSNGSGKSSIWEGISWCLTGETIRGSKDVVNNYGNDGALVELEFSVDGDNFRIIRSKDHSEYKTNLKIFINDEDKSGKGIRDTSKLLTEYLPDITSSLIGSVIILGQGLPQRFTNNSPAGRKEVLEKLSKSDFMIEDLKNRITNRKSELSTELRTCEDDILAFNSKINLLKSQISENQIKLASLNSNEELEIIASELNTNISDCANKIEDLNNKLESMRVEYQNIANGKNIFNEQIANITNEKSSIITEQSSINTKIATEKLDINSKFSKIQIETESTWNIKINDVYKKYTAVSAELQSKKSELFKMQNVKDTCPTCGQKLPGVFKPDTSEIERAIQSLITESTIFLEQYNTAKNDKQLELDNIINQCNCEINEVAPKYSNILNDIQNRLNLKDTEINKCKIEISKIDNTLSNIVQEANSIKSNVTSITLQQSNYKNRLDAIHKEKESLENNKIAAQSIIDSNTHQIEEISKLIEGKESEKIIINAHIDVVNKMSTVITRDFRGYLLMNVINFINDKSKEYSQLVFGTDKINFNIDGNNISISYDNKEYESLSGGEKQKVDLIVQFAIRDMLCRYLGFSSNILVLDEIADNVDSYGAERLFNLISKKLNDVESVYIVSHHVDFAMPMDNELIVTKGIDKISRITQ